MNDTINRRLLWIFLFVSATSVCLAQGPDFKDAMNSILFNPNGQDQIILVVFGDQNINRVHSGSPTAFYRKRGEYKGSTWSKRVTEDILEDYSLQYLADWPMTEVGAHCVVYRVPDAISVDQVLLKLDQDSRIDFAQRMHLFKTSAGQYKDPYFGLQSSLDSLRISDIHSRTTGKDIKIALIDTGVDFDHPDLQGTVETTQNFVSVVSSGFSGDAHGTAVAGIIAAQPDNDIGIVGIAPGATLHALKACWPDKAGSMDAACNSFTLALAINAAIRSEVDIINMSLTGPDDRLMTLLLNAAIERGIIVVAADADTNQQDSELGFPASLENVIAVRSIDEGTAYNSTAKKLVRAPGMEILTTFPRGAYDFASGSSLATAHISGVVALLRQIEPDISTENLFKLLKDESSSTICKILCDNSNVSEGTETNRVMSPFPG